MSGTVLRRLLGGGLALGGVAALGMLSNAPYAAAARDRALIRLSWRAFSEQVRACRRLTPDELARLPIHMRQEEVCERTILPYRLAVMLDDALVADVLVRSGGAREDRPLYVFHEVPVVPGRHRVAVTFRRQDEQRGERREEEETTAEQEARETPPLLSLDETVGIAERAVLLVTYDEAARRLRLLAAPERSP